MKGKVTGAAAVVIHGFLLSLMTSCDGINLMLNVDVHIDVG